MNGCKSILCAVDQSPGADAALGVAARLARQLDGQVTLIHVVAPHAGEALLAPPPAAIAPPQVETDRWTAAASDLSGKQVTLHVASGEPAAAIVEFAREKGFDLIVMASRSRSRVRLALGSVTAKVIVDAPCPVVVVSPESRERELLRQDFPGQVA